MEVVTIAFFLEFLSGLMVFNLVYTLFIAGVAGCIHTELIDISAC